MSLIEIAGFSIMMNLKMTWNIPWDNTLSSNDISSSLAFDLFFARLNTVLGEHAPNHKLSKKEISLKAKP